MTAVSVNEVQGLLSKAARGAGAPPAQAAAFGQAGVYHLACGGDTAVLSSALAQGLTGPIIDCPKQIQCTMSQSESVTFIVSDDPADALLSAYLDALPFQATRRSDGAIEVTRTVFQRPDLPARLQVAEDVLAGWKALAARTFVPETEQSRRAGAGAGLTDND